MIENYFPLFPVLKTTRFVLRQLTPNDEQEIFVLRSDEGVLKYLDIPKAKSLNDARKFIDKIYSGNNNNWWVYWAISFKNESKLLGTICLWNISEDKTTADIGFTLLPEFQGKGIMQEVIRVVLNYGFIEMKLEKIQGEVSPGNVRSIQLLEKFGFTCTSESENTLIYLLKNRS
ncbi:MAG: GNAT family N-acetyltransferase [Ignavibacteriaceae bacterium]|jgi:ribosomal-protein-alanine N-acetyltransferase